jgi:hypothetical protein
MVLAMVVEAVIVLGAAGLTFLLPRRAGPRSEALAEEPAAEFSAGAVH